MQIQTSDVTESQWCDGLYLHVEISMDLYGFMMYEEDVCSDVLDMMIHKVCIFDSFQPLSLVALTAYPSNCRVTTDMQPWIRAEVYLLYSDTPLSNCVLQAAWYKSRRLICHFISLTSPSLYDYLRWLSVIEGVMKPGRVLYTTFNKPNKS